MLVETVSRDAGFLDVDLETARYHFVAGEYEAALAIIGQIGRDESETPDRRLWALLLEASALSEMERYPESLEAVQLASALVDDGPAKLRAAFYGQRAHVNIKLGKKDDPLIDYAAAKYWAEQAGDELNVARVMNNMAGRYSEVGRHLEAVNEVDGAIRIAARLKDYIHMGRFYDQKAQILINAKHFPEAVACSKKAVALLCEHPSLAEARCTYGRALIRLGASYLDTPTTIEEFRKRRNAAAAVEVSLNPTLIQRALKRTGGHILTASQLLGVSHSLLIRATERHGIARHPKRTRTKK